MILKKTRITDDQQLYNVKYKWAYELLEKAISNTWFPHEVMLDEDMADWKKMTNDEKEAITVFMGFFNPSEFMVNQSIIMGMFPYISAPEARMYLTRQLWEEVNHSMSFNYVINTFAIDRDKAFKAHTQIPAVKAKEDFFVHYIKSMSEGNIDVDSVEGKQTFVKNVVATNIIMEGILFYGGFMFALSFRQRNLMRNFASLIDWVARDEAVHLQFGMDLILTILDENPEIVTSAFASEIKEMILHAVNLERAYNETMLPNGILGISSEYVNKYIEYVADRRLEELSLGKHFNTPNPAKWMSAANDTFQLVNFFEAINTSYQVNGKHTAASQNLAA